MTESDKLRLALPMALQVLREFSNDPTQSESERAFARAALRRHAKQICALLVSEVWPTA